MKIFFLFHLFFEQIYLLYIYTYIIIWNTWNVKLYHRNKATYISPISLYKLSSRTICLQIYDRVDKRWILSANRQNPPIS